MQKFEPFQRVLVRPIEDGIWRCDFYSHEFHKDMFMTIGGYCASKTDILLYNDETKHLLGTKDDPTPKWVPKPGELVAVRDAQEDEWKVRVFRYHDNDNGFVCNDEVFRVKTCVWNFCEPLSKHFKVPE